jgi:DNA-binding NarL/FixJ family response regulator
MSIQKIILENDKIFLEIIKEGLEIHGVPDVEGTHDTNEFLNMITKNPTVAILDFYLDNITAIEVVRRIANTHPLCSYIFMSSMVSVDMLIEISNLDCRFYFVRKDKTDFLEDLSNKIRKAENVMKAKIDAILEQSQRTEVIKEKASEILKKIENS